METKQNPEWNEVVHGLGLVSIHFQALESVIKIAIGELIIPADSVIGALVTAELSFKAASHLLYALANYRWEDDPATLQTLRKVLGRCDHAEGKRNRMIHSDWFREKEGAVRIKFTARNRKKGLDIQRENTAPADMNELAEELKSCKHALFAVLLAKVPDLNHEYARLRSEVLETPTEEIASLKSDQIRSRV
jgi:hypothetical protein